MDDSAQEFRIKRVSHQGPEAEYWLSQLNEYVLPFFGRDIKQRRKFPLPDDTILLIAEDISQPDIDGKHRAVGSVAIKKLLPGDEQSEGLPDGTRYGEIKRMVVTKEYRGTGVAAKLLETAEDAGKTELGLQCIVVETLRTLKPARRFYEKAGYKERSTFGVYHEEDSVCYEKWV
ncbi:hypothetical protein M409DRAFT_15844 [Zasmidium cellare ATCC 36951]|uniref:N-acetyltransferase domain-containing protein n=1 Tax=Zasmidium cellare ATCC 36951 TaxID=1080233 RepID=A0A6A6D2B5_ZASCE|nr:uncharacterized protein M409DRAFT_15844 [Zasmidium cellare ATCC 36951]KAF2173564.1 hypothetical protein M409DRAFT_15844 [Zasmidium cellare ATCC 36951]